MYIPPFDTNHFPQQEQDCGIQGQLQDLSHANGGQTPNVGDGDMAAAVVAAFCKPVQSLCNLLRQPSHRPTQHVELTLPH